MHSSVEQQLRRKPSPSALRMGFHRLNLSRRSLCPDNFTIETMGTIYSQAGPKHFLFVDFKTNTLNKAWERVLRETFLVVKGHGLDTMDQCLGEKQAFFSA